MNRDNPLICYVSIPFGTKQGPMGESIDFERIYSGVVKPVLEEAGFVAMRADSLVTRGTVQKAIIEQILYSDVMIADITTLNPNVLYELGVRHGVKRSGTILICADSTRPSFNISHLFCIFYHLIEGALKKEHAEPFGQRLLQVLKEIRRTDIVDSPVYEYFPSLSIDLSEGTKKNLKSKKENAQSLRAQLVEVRRMLPAQGVPQLKQLEQDILDAAVEDPSLRADLLMAFRDAAAWDEVVRLADGFPKEIKEQPLAVQQLAMALNRRNSPGDRERASVLLEQLIDRKGGDSETYGLLGRIHKDRYTDTEDTEALDASIEAYRKGFVADPADYYPGINLVTLLMIRGGESALQEMNEIIPKLRDSLQKRAESGRVDYWEMATNLELAALARDWDAAKVLASETRARAPSRWMVETTARNLDMIANNLPDLTDRSKMRSLIRYFKQDLKSGVDHE